MQGELPEGAVRVVRGKRYFVTVEWLLPVLDLLPSSVIRIKAEAGLEDGESRRDDLGWGKAQALEAAVDQAILVAAKLDADRRRGCATTSRPGPGRCFQRSVRRHVTPHSRARVPDVWLKARREKRRRAPGARVLPANFSLSSTLVGRDRPSPARVPARARVA